MPTDTEPLPQGAAPVTSRLSEAVFATVVAHAPLIAIDLLVTDSERRLLLGWRRHPPARNAWFVPGGRIRKQETLAAAFERLTQEELGRRLAIDDSLFVGVYQHFYDDDFRGERTQGTHYIVLAHCLRCEPDSLRLPDAQHTSYRWASAQELRSDPRVHRYTRDYLQPLSAAISA